MVGEGPKIFRVFYRKRLLNTRQLAGGYSAVSTRLVSKIKLRKLNIPAIKSAWTYESRQGDHGCKRSGMQVNGTRVLCLWTGCCSPIGCRNLLATHFVILLPVASCQLASYRVWGVAEFASYRWHHVVKIIHCAPFEFLIENLLQSTHYCPIFARYE